MFRKKMARWRFEVSDTCRNGWHKIADWSPQRCVAAILTVLATFMYLDMLAKPLGELVGLASIWIGINWVSDLLGTLFVVLTIAVIAALFWSAIYLIAYSNRIHISVRH